MTNIIVSWIRNQRELICIKSIRAALREQRLLAIFDRLSTIVPNIANQYSAFNLDSDYLITKVRAQHSFQIALFNETLMLINPKDSNTITIVDIGDSAGTHVQYIKSLHKHCKLSCLSVNMDGKAVKKIRQKGMEAICARAEDLASLSVEADIFLSFEMLEHLMNPCGFLRSLSEKTNCKAFVVTVPYVARSRVGLHHIRHNQKRKVSAENTHIFELSPEDWRLIFRHSGWTIESEKVFLQYPRRSLLGFLMKCYWKRRDFEGFYGAILKRNRYWSDLYNGW